MTRNNESSSRQTTDYLRGIAILTVVVNHFLNEYVTHSMGGYANGMVSIFFILSGYGIYFSLTKGFKKCSLNQLVVTFWKQRILRIYPLFWIYYFLKYKFQIKVVQFLALDFIRPEILWFIPAIIQCYIIAPFLFVLMKKLGVKLYSIALVAGFIMLNAILLSAGYPTVASIAYHGYHGGFFFSHILLFGTGFIIAHLSSTKPEALSNFSVCLITLIFIFFLHETTPQTQIHFHGSRIVLEVFFLLFSILCVYSVLNSNSYLPFSKFFQGLGIYSYSIFLFHRNYFKGLEKIGILGKYDVSPGSMLICIILLPVFLASVAYFEEIVNGMVNRNFNLKDITRKYYSKIFL